MVTKIRHSVFLRFLVFVLSFVAASVMVSSLILIGFSYAQFKFTISNDYRGIIKSSANEIRFFVMESLNSVESLARILAHVRWTADEAGQDIALAAFGFTNEKFTNPVLLRPDGTRKLPQFPSDPDIDYRSTATFSKALEGQTAISEVRYSEDRLPFLRIAVPIRRLGKVAEILWVELNLKEVWNVLEGIKIGEKGHVSVLSATGHYISHLEIQPVLKRITQDNMAALEKIRFKDEVIDWREANTGQYCMAVHIADLDWYVMLSQPMGEIYGHIYRSLFWISGLALLLCLLATFIGWQWVKRLLQPLKTLHQQVKVIGTGDLDQPVAVNTEDEIGDLGREFNAMTESLKQVIADKVRTERELAHAKSLAVLGQASGKITHEVGNLVNNTSLFLNILKRNPLDEQSRKLVGLLQGDMDRAMIFVQDCLQFARKPQFDKARVPMGPYIEEALVAHREAALQQGVTLASRWADGLPTIQLNAARIQQVINNLVKNSLEALLDAGGNGYITVSAYPSNNDVCLSVADNGPGIPPETQANIFEPFFTTKGKDGTGLGLAIIKEIMNAHGGRIEFVSPPDGGAEFRLYFPVETEPSPT
ncbi:MAG: sensor histidine kinase [Pseudomonadota bacterium]